MKAEIEYDVKAFERDASKHIQIVSARTSSIAPSTKRRASEGGYTSPPRMRSRQSLPSSIAVTAPSLKKSIRGSGSCAGRTPLAARADHLGIGSSKSTAAARDGIALARYL